MLQGEPKSKPAEVSTSIPVEKKVFGNVRSIHVQSLYPLKMCVCVCVHACVRVRVCVCVHACVRACACVYVYIHCCSWIPMCVQK